MNCLEQELMNLIERQSECYYIQWKGESIAEGIGFTISAPYVIGSQDKKWTLRMASMIIDNFPSKTKAEQALQIIFVKSREKHGTLFRKTRHGMKVFIQK